MPGRLQASFRFCFERNLVFFFAVGTVGDDGLDAEFGGFLYVCFGQLRGDIEVSASFWIDMGFPFLRLTMD